MFINNITTKNYKYMLVLHTKKLLQEYKDNNIEKIYN